MQRVGDEFLAGAALALVAGSGNITSTTTAAGAASVGTVATAATSGAVSGDLATRLADNTESHAQADDASYDAATAVTVTLAEPDPNAVCTTDFIARGTYFEVPEGVDPAKDVTVSFDGAGFQGRVPLSGNSALSAGTRRYSNCDVVVRLPSS